MASLVYSADSLRTALFGAITGSYTALGTPMGHNVRMIRIINNTDGDILISFDSIVDNWYIPAGSFVLYDVTANVQPPVQTFVFRLNTQVYIKYDVAPTRGKVCLESGYGSGE